METLNNYYDIVVLDSGVLETHKSIDNKSLKMLEIKSHKDGLYEIIAGGSDNVGHGTAVISILQNQIKMPIRICSVKILNESNTITGCEIDRLLFALSYIKENISDKQIKIAAITTVLVIALVSIILIIKYKLNGFLSAILSIGFIAVSLLIIRYTNVYISIAGLIGIATIAIINYLLQFNILKNEKKSEEEKVSIWKVYSKFLFNILPIFIISLIFSFATSVLLNSFGMIVFWGILITFLYNIVFTNNILKN